ncbi:hypothetical protein DM02DRAFT_554611 [Periconia macrospinosa]|uniref:Aminoglycoside phosphotransferase domain-containing protein n=1 Tax=Periconia macrospinosa TaxID=97972 RepID=A0A2V1E7U4_9PLEO|nr:hypothetical protein DM02DRAFT_554611 [Periconia macrospinosa]
MARRHVRFNVHELAACAAKAVGARSCISIEKYPEGLYNKSMLLTMDEGSQVVARVPNPNAGIPHFTTASEVATMDFVKDVLGTPLPKVLAWNSRAEDSPVGTEYIIMEKAPGIELEQVWPQMCVQDRLSVVKKIASFQKAWTSVSFKQYGGLYYTKDLEDYHKDQPLYTDANGVDVKDKTFAIGPSPGRENVDYGRGTVEFDRGPWNTLESYHKAIGDREIAAVTKLPELPKSPITLCGPGTYIPTRERKLQALQCYQKILKYCLPTDESITSGHLWHGDLHEANIFVDPAEPTKVVSIIDWQSTEVAPLYFHARQPYIIDHQGPSIEGFVRPQLPTNMNELDLKAQSQATDLFYRQALCFLYRKLTHIHIPRIHAALEFQESIAYDLLLVARNLVIDGEVAYLSQLLDLETEWNKLPGAAGHKCPLSFTQGDREEIEAQHEGVVRGMEAMDAIREAMGELFPERGIVETELYNEALDALAQMKEQVIAHYARTEEEKRTWEKMWPFGS